MVKTSGICRMSALAKRDKGNSPIRVSSSAGALGAASLVLLCIHASFCTLDCDRLCMFGNSGCCMVDWRSPSSGCSPFFFFVPLNRKLTSLSFSCRCCIGAEVQHLQRLFPAPLLLCISYRNAESEAPQCARGILRRSHHLSAFGEGSLCNAAASCICRSPSTG